MHAAFWAGAGVSLAALLAVGRRPAAVPATPRRRLDVVGAVLLGAGLAGLLLALGEAEIWGWTSPLLWGLLGGAVRRAGRLGGLGDADAVPAGRPPAGRAAARRDRARRRAAGRARATTCCSPPSRCSPRRRRASGAGFGTSIVVAGLVLLPFSLASVLAGRLARLLADRAGARAVLPVAALVQGGAFVLFALARIAAVGAVPGHGGGRPRRRRRVRRVPRADRLRRPRRRRPAAR